MEMAHTHACSNEGDYCFCLLHNLHLFLLPGLRKRACEKTSDMVINVDVCACKGACVCVQSDVHNLNFLIGVML